MTCSLTFPIGPALSSVVLLAERSAQAQRADTGQMLAWLLVAAVVIGVVCVVVVIVNRMFRRWRLNSHPSLFCGLSKVHGLDSATRRLLKRVVRFHRLAQPGRVFVEPQWLDPTNLDASFQGQAAELAEIRKEVFRVGPTSGATA
ncbi:MAG: hypothetical protein ABIP48_25780 [Planctomycetota bacterium]